MELVEGLQHFGTVVHALRWVIAIPMGAFFVTWALMVFATSTRPTRTTTRARAPRDPYAHHIRGCRCPHHR